MEEGKPSRTAESKKKLTAVFVTDSARYAHLPVDNHGPVHFRRPWRLLINVAVVVLSLLLLRESKSG